MTRDSVAGYRAQNLESMLPSNQSDRDKTETGQEETREQKAARRKSERKEKLSKSGQFRENCKCTNVMIVLITEIVITFIFMIIAAASLRDDLWNEH